MRLVAEIEAIGAVAIAIAEGERPDRDGQRLERGWRAVARRFACQDARDVGFEGNCLDGIAAARLGEPDAELQRRRAGGPLQRGRGRPARGQDQKNQELSLHHCSNHPSRHHPSSVRVR